MSDYERGLADDLANTVDTGKPSRFTKMMRGTVTSILMESAIPWLMYCFSKYTEQDFHQKVLYEQFDFIEDWKANHYNTYYDFINKARNRVVKRFIDFNIVKITNKVVALLQKRGWYIYPQEYDVLLDTVRRVRIEIYGY